MRVTDMRGVDLSVYAFDWDLTFAALAMRADGTVYHRFGGRDHRSADTWLGMPAFRRMLEATLEEHDAWLESRERGGTPAPERAEAHAAPEATRTKPLRLEDVPAFARKDRGECIHCHSVFPALYEQGRADATWPDGAIWVHPPPGRIGVDLDREDQSRVTHVVPGSPAERAGWRVGDRLLQLGPQRIVTVSDVSWVLHRTDPDGAVLPATLERDGERRDAPLRLDRGWKKGTPRTFAWRPFKWGLLPAPGFGGPELGAGEKRALGIDADAFAFRVTYLVTWGDNRRFGQAAARAGIRERDVFLSAAGERDFASVDHFHAWWRLTRAVGERVEVELLRDGEPRVVELEVLP